MRPHTPAPTSHTLELTQVREINERLAAVSDQHPVTAQALGVEGEAVRARRDRVPLVPWLPATTGHLPTGAVLDRVAVEGPPTCPYVWGVFRSPAGDRPVNLHTGALVRLSRALGLTGHRWGDGWLAG